MKDLVERKTNKRKSGQNEPLVIRRKILSLGDMDLIGLFSNKVKITNIPAGAEIHRVNYSHRSGCWDVVLEHDSFEITKEGCEYPSFYAKVKAV